MKFNILRNPDAADSTGGNPLPPVAPADTTAPAIVPAAPVAPAKRPGRPPGSTTLTAVSLADLNALFGDKNQQIVVGVKWLRATKVAVTAKTAPAAVITESAKPEPTVAIQAGDVAV